VVNHGYRDGTVTTINSVLQAGTAVLVDDYGVAAVRCDCGIEQGLYLTRIMTYHYNNGTPPGTIALRAGDGTVYGPWPAEGSEGQGAVANAYWTAYPGTEIPPGRYTIVDSDPSTWSWADDTNGRGITEVYGIWTVQY
jgi:hypothetical protein